MLTSNINSLYLRVGNLSEILSMNYWRFISILQTAKTENTTKSGKPVIKNKLYQSQRDMIQRTRELNNNE